MIAIFKREVLPAYPKIKGARGGQLFINRQSGAVLTVGIYDNQEAAEAFGPVAAAVMPKLVPLLDGTQPEREIYEMAASTGMEARAVVERGLDAFNRGDLEQIARDAAPDITYTVPGGQVFEGPQAVKDYNQSWRNAFPNAKVEVDQLLPLGNTVTVQGRFIGTHAGTLVTPMGDIPATGKKVVGAFVQIFTIDRGLVSSVALYFDRVDLMTQLGVAPAGVSTSASA
ncbi:MAG: hypothetical protein NVS9B1_21710 [Candidatus Dormibacteraceae bacterium]